MKAKQTPGAKCSKNFVLKKQITSIAELYAICETQPSIYWRHKIFPTAVLMQQKICELANGLKLGWFWEVERINNQMFYTELATLAEKYNFENVEVDFENIEYHTKGVKEIILIRATRYNAQYEND
jgi:hypothetical protein